MNIGGYMCVECLGSGGMGTVYKVKDRAGKFLAIKMIGSDAAVRAAVEGGKGAQVQALDIRHRMMLVREASLAIELAHPNIVRTLDYGQHEGLLYIVLEYLHGRSLDKVIPLQRAVSILDKVRMIRQVCEALQYAHAHSVIHRDIKPPNIFVIEDGSVKVLDFGLAARVQEALPGEASLVGTPQYMAPEVISGARAYGATVDIWATGVTLYQLLTGRLPFSGITRANLFTNILHSQYLTLDVQIPKADHFDHIFRRALAKDPRRRYQSAADLGEDLSLLTSELEEQRSQGADERLSASNEMWWASTIQVQSISKHSVLKTGSTPIRMSYTELTRPIGGASFRFARYNRFVIPPTAKLLVGLSYLYLLFIVIPSLLSIGSARQIISEMLARPSSPPALLLFQVFTVLMLSAVLISIFLGVWAAYERLSEIPCCPSCLSRMKHKTRIDRFSYTDKSRTHALSDCKAALIENLWEDAGKLLSLHGQVFLPKSRVTGSIIRYCLDFYECSVCHVESAIFSSEASNNRTRVSSDEQHRADRGGEQHSKDGHRLGERVRRLKEAVLRASTLATESLDRNVAIFVIVTSVLCCIYSLRPHLLWSKVFDSAERVTVLVTSSPPNQVLAVDGKPVVTPKSFFWEIGSHHTIGGLDDRTIYGHAYRFMWLREAPFGALSFNSSQNRMLCKASNSPKPVMCVVRIMESHERGRSPKHAEIGSYSVDFSEISLDKGDEGKKGAAFAMKAAPRISKDHANTASAGKNDRKQMFEFGGRRPRSNAMVYSADETASARNAFVATSIANACEKGFAASCSNLARLYETGSEVTRNRQRALFYYQKACDLGESNSCARREFLQEAFDVNN